MLKCQQLESQIHPGDSDKLRNLLLRFGGVPVEHFPPATDKNSRNGHVSSNGHGESLAAGLLLLDASLRPIYASEKALAILAYPGVPSKNKGFDLAESDH